MSNIQQVFAFSVSGNILTHIFALHSWIFYNGLDIAACVFTSRNCDDLRCVIRSNFTHVDSWPCSRFTCFQIFLQSDNVSDNFSLQTTLLNHILTSQHGKRIAVIENEVIIFFSFAFFLFLFGFHSLKNVYCITP